MNSERVPACLSAARTRTASPEQIDHSGKMRISGKRHAAACPPRPSQIFTQLQMGGRGDSLVAARAHGDLFAAPGRTPCYARGGGCRPGAGGELSSMLGLSAERCEVSDVSARRNTSAGPKQGLFSVPEREEISMGPDMREALGFGHQAWFALVTRYCLKTG